MPLLRSKNTAHYMALGSFFLIGGLPIFWDLLKTLESHTVLMHRCFWMFVFLLPFVWVKIELRLLINDFFKILLSSLFIGLNWFCYIYAINHQYVLEASLAYFLAPMFTLLLNVIFYREKLNLLQMLSLILVFAAIVFLLIAERVFPTIGVVIGMTFSLYGLMGKKIQTSSALRMCVESLVVLSVMFVFFQPPITVAREYVALDMTMKGLLVVSGLLTLAPFYLLNRSVKTLPFSTVGLLNFIVPTLIFLIGVFYFHEPIDRFRLFALGVIWISCVVYASSLFFEKKKEYPD